MFSRVVTRSLDFPGGLSLHVGPILPRGPGVLSGPVSSVRLVTLEVRSGPQAQSELLSVLDRTCRFLQRVVMM